MAARLLIYGATGYTGALLSERCAELGIGFVAAGRNAQKVAALAERCGAESHRAFSLDDPEQLKGHLADFDCVIHAAGPFSKTARQMMDACIASGTHYLDITGEFSTYALARDLSDQAEAAGVMLMPGIGWDVVPSDCLSAHTAQRVVDPVHIRIALNHFGGVSRGSALSGGEIARLGPLVRRDGELVKLDAMLDPIMVDFGEGPESCAQLAMGDLITVYRVTGVPNITEFFQSEMEDVPEDFDPSALPDGPTAEERDAGRSKVHVQVTGADGTVKSSLINTESGYTYTQKSGVEIARRVVAGDFKTGWQTPASAYGPELATQIGDAYIVDLD